MTNLRRAAPLLLAALAACSGGHAQSVLPQQSGADASRAAGKISHIVIIIQENRSFDNLFSGFPGADAPTTGLVGESKVTLIQTPFESPDIIENRYRDAVAGWNHGRMNGFEREHYYGAQNFPYSVVPRSETAPYWALARQWTLADRMFPTEFGASFTGHLSLISSNTEIENGAKDEVDYPTTLPWSCNAPTGTTTFTLDHNKIEHPYGPFPCFSGITTIADNLDAAHLSWRYYAPDTSDGISQAVWTEFGAIASIYNGPDWQNIVTPSTRVFSDIAAGALPNVSWVIPDWRDSDHPGSDSASGPSWVASVVNAVGTSKYWKSTAIVLVWDDWGGWYDNVPPPQKDFRGLGIRTPAIFISPYARAGKTGSGLVSHTQYEFGSIMHFVEDVFGLPVIGPASQGYTDARATSLIDAFDLTQAPRPFHTIPAPLTKNYFLHEKPSMRAPDDY